MSLMYCEINEIIKKKLTHHHLNNIHNKIIITVIIIIQFLLHIYKKKSIFSPNSYRSSNFVSYSPSNIHNSKGDSVQ